MLNKMYKTFNKVSDYFEKPELKWHIGRFKFGLPMYIPRERLRIVYLDVMWKHKYDTPRFEYPPQLNIIFFGKWRIMFWLKAPFGKDNDHQYWEQLIWTAEYCDGDLKKAKETWLWRDATGHSTWSDLYIVKTRASDLNGT